MFSLAVVGSRSFDDYQLMEYEIDRIFKRKWLDDPERRMCIVSGGARGADQLAKRYVKEHNKEVHYVEHPPDWKLHGKAAGKIRNVDIVKDSKMVLAFWDGKSKGTKHTLSVAQTLGTKTKVVRF